MDSFSGRGELRVEAMVGIGTPAGQQNKVNLALIVTVVLTIVVTNLWSFFTRLCALTPRVVLSPGWLGGTTNGSTACVVDSTNESRGFVGRPRGGDAAAWLGYTVPNQVGGFFD
jgi:hypothetical protein